MVEKKRIETKNDYRDLKEGLRLVVDFVHRGASLIVIGGIFYFVPALAMLKLATRPHDVLNMAHMTYDAAKLAYFITKGVIYKLI